MNSSGCRQCVELGAGEPGERKPARVGSLEVGKRKPQGLGCVVAQFAAAQYEQHRRAGEPVREVAK
jgi:hypothetical protein